MLCFLNVILRKMYLKPVGYLIKNLMFMAIDVLNEQQKKGIYIMVKEMIIRFSTFSAIVILVAFLTKSEAVTLYVIGLTSGLMIGYAYGNRNN